MHNENVLREKLGNIHLPGLRGVCLNWYYNPSEEFRMEEAIKLFDWLKGNMTVLRSIEELNALRTAAWWIRDVCKEERDAVS